ncbi:MAG: hypothetical protein AAGB18_00845 [Pseudomonadota bacterium]
MKRLVPVMLVGLLGCAPDVPNSAQGTGVGFGDYESYAAESARREALLSGQSLPQATPTDPVISLERSTSDTVVVTAPSRNGDVLIETPSDDQAVVVAALPEPGAAPARSAGNAALSDEQDFEAVSSRESIESDAERIERQRAGYQVVAPTDVPERPRDTGPNIVAYALATTNQVGQQVYRRSPVNAEARYQRACARYTSPDLAQTAFLEMGGPDNDRRGMDPDGDGFACTWDPAPFRTARQ